MKKVGTGPREIYERDKERKTYNTKFDTNIKKAKHASLVNLLKGRKYSYEIDDKKIKYK